MQLITTKSKRSITGAQTWLRIIETIQDQKDCSSRNEAQQYVVMMNAAINSAIVFPTSPNWYCTRVSDCNQNGVFGFGSKNYVMLLNSTSKIFLRPLEGHDQRISAFSFCKATGAANFCVSGCIGKRVKLWNIDNYECVKQHNDHKAEITAVSTSPLGADLIVSGDTEGRIVVWRWHSDEKKIHVPITGQSIFSLACSPNDADIVVIGYQSGNIAIVNVTTGEVVHRLVGHVDEIHAVDWAPLSYDQNEDGEESKPNEAISRSLYLLTSSKDKTIRVWDSNDFSLVTTLQIPKPTGQYHEGQKTRVWITACFSPTSPHIIISSNLIGELIKWDIRNKNKQTKFASGHSRPIFNIATCLHNGFSNLYTVSMDRAIIMWDEKSRQKVWDTSSMGGFVYSIDINPTDPARLVAAIGDNTIRVCNLNYTEKTENMREPHQTHTIWKGLQSKVTVVRWHPEDMSTFAYGTDDGRIGLCKIDTNQPMLFQSYHKRTVYEIEFGPAPPAHVLEALKVKEKKQQDVPNEAESDKPSNYSHLYTCGGDGQILVFNSKNSRGNPININDIIARVNPNIGEVLSKTKSEKIQFPQRSEFAWKKDFSLLAVGNVDGSVELYDGQFKFIKQFKDHIKLINRIRWHEPVEGEGNTRWAHVFASASSDFTVHVYDVTSLMSAQGESVTKTEHIGAASSEILATLKGHKNSVVDLSWSMHEPQLLASCSYDGTIQVWDVLLAKPLHIMRGHFGKALTISWSHVKAPIIYSGGEDQTIRRWNILQFNAEIDTTPSAKAKAKPRTSKAQQAVQESQPQEIEQTNSTPSTPTKVVPQQEPVSIVSTSKVAKKTKSKSLFANFDPNHDSRLQAHSSTLLFAQNLAGDTDHHIDTHGLTQEHVATVNGLFETTKSIEPFVHSEEKTHQQANNWDPYLVLELWQGNSVEAFKTVVQQNILNESWLALSPMSGAEVWRQMNVVFAKHLESEGEIHRAVLHLLAINHIEDAIKTYQRNTLFADAIALARLRLHAQHPLITAVYLDWARHLEERIMFEHAAKCYLAIKDWSKAVQSMARRGDLLAIKGAWQLCRYLLQINETDELQLIEHDLREKLFLLYITSEFEGNLDFVLLKALLLENDRLQYGLIVMITWLALLQSVNEDYGANQIGAFFDVFGLSDEPLQVDKEHPTLCAFLKDFAGTEVVSIASELASHKLTTNGQTNNVNFVSLFDSVDPFTTSSRSSAAGKFYGTWCSLYSALVKSKLIDPSLLQATHVNITNANDTLSRLQGSAKKGDEMLLFSQFVLSLIANDVPDNRHIPQAYKGCSVAVQALVLALHALYYTSLNKRSYRLSALTRVIMPTLPLDAQSISQSEQCNTSLAQDLVDSLMAYVCFNQLFWIVHQFRERKTESEQRTLLDEYKDKMDVIKQKLLSDHHNQVSALDSQMGELLKSIRLAEEQQDTERVETLKLQEKLLEKKLSLIKQHVLVLPFPDWTDTNKLLAVLETK